MSLYDKYEGVKTAQDLIDMGCKPKLSSEMLKIVADLRLSAIRNSILEQVNPEMFGEWAPAFVPVASGDGVPVSELEEIVRAAAPGMKVRGIVTTPFGDTPTYSGTVKSVNDTYLGIEWDENVRDGSDLGGYAADGKGEWISHYDINRRHLELLISEGIDHYELAEGVVADKQLGHKVFFSREYKGNVLDPGGSLIAHSLPAGVKAMLVEYNSRRGIAQITSENNIEGMGNRKNFVIDVKQAAGMILVSSLGQIEPRNLEEEVYKQALQDFFPYTILDTKTARDTIVAMLMEKDIGFYGPPGSGKTELARDIVHILRQQEVIFHVEGCKVQCNPFSVFDEEFAKKVQPCPECQIAYYPDFRKTGRFKSPKPSDIKVVVAKIGDGKGAEFLQGSVALQGIDLIGFKIPKIDGSDDELGSQFDPEGFSPGALPRSNDGVLHIGEMEKIRPAVMDNFLSAIADGRVKPDQLRYSYPANSVIVATINDITVVPDNINDRMVLIPVKYSDDRDEVYQIIRRAFYGERQDAADINIDDPHVVGASILRNVPMPAIIERAVAGLYIMFRKEYKGPGMQRILGSNRSLLDALPAARAELLIDHKFFKNAPAIADESYAVKGILYSLLSRVQEKSDEEHNNIEKSIADFVKERFPKVLQEEINTWWCRLYKNKLAVMETLLPHITENFHAEIKSYREHSLEPWDTFASFRDASRKNNKLEDLPFKFPFMAYLFEEQPNIEVIKKEQFGTLMDYLLKTQEVATCS